MTLGPYLIVINRWFEIKDNTGAQIVRVNFEFTFIDNPSLNLKLIPMS